MSTRIVVGMRFRKRPIVIEAVQFDGSNADAIVAWAQNGWGDHGIWLKQKVFPGDPTRAIFFLVIPTPEGEHEAAPGDWIIRGIAGELYPCKSAVFEATYDRVP